MGVKSLNHGFGGLPGFGHYGRQEFGSATRMNVSYETRSYGSRDFGGFGKGFGGFGKGFKGLGGFRGADRGHGRSFSGGYSATSLRASDGFGRTRGYDAFRNFGDFGNARGFQEFGRNSGGYGRGFGAFNHFSNLALNKAEGGFGGFGAPVLGRAIGYGPGGGGELRSVQTWGDARGLSDFGFHRPGSMGEPTIVGGYGPGGGGEFRRAAVYEGHSFGGFGGQSFGDFGGFGGQSFGDFGGFGSQSFGDFSGFGGFGGQSFGGFGGFGFGHGAPTKSYDVAFDPSASAGYDNAVGVYEVTPRGDLVNARLLAPSAHDAEGGVTTIDGVRPGNKLGFFIMQNGADLASQLGAGDKLSFRAEDGSRANLADGSPILAVNGKPVDQTVYHSFGPSLNPDGLKHAIKDTNGRDSGTIAFEDLDFGGDRDFDDVILHVQPNRNRFWG